MSRVSQEELYNDKDVVTQILKLKDTVNDYAGGIIENIDVSGNDLVIEWADGESISLPLPSPTGISSIAGSVSGTDLTITIYMTDGSSHAFTTPLNGIATESYVDTGLAAKQDVLTFDDAPTYGSDNPVKSNGIYTAIAGKLVEAVRLADLAATPVDGLMYAFQNMAAGCSIEVATVSDGTNAAYGLEVNAREILNPPLSSTVYFQCNGAMQIGTYFYNLYQMAVNFDTGVLTFYYISGTSLANISITPVTVTGGFWLHLV